MRAWGSLDTPEKRATAFWWLRDRVSQDGERGALTVAEADVLSREFLGMPWSDAVRTYSEAGDAVSEKQAIERTRNVQRNVGVAPGTKDYRTAYERLAEWLRCDNATAPWPWPDSWARNLCYLRNAMLGGVAIGAAAFALYLTRAATD